MIQLKLFFKNQLIPLSIAIILSVLCFLFLDKYFQRNQKTKIISGGQTLFAKNQPNYASGEGSEINFLACLNNKKLINIFGSSELSDLPYCAHNFLPDSLNIPAVSFGHAYHQNFSMFCELLAARTYLKKSKIVVILSPSWFVTSGTNVEAFLEFVPQNFLKQIIQDDEISARFKHKIGKYIFDNRAGFQAANDILNYFETNYKYRNTPLLDKISTLKKDQIDLISYKLTENKSTSTIKSIPIFDFARRQSQIQNTFISEIKSNAIFVNDVYYQTYLSTKDKPFEKGVYKQADFKNNTEMEDFEYVLEALRAYDVNASFVIQPLNNYYYEGLNFFKPTVFELEQKIKKAGFPYLNLFTYSEKSYDKGVLGDIMHLGNYGWLKVNEFIVKTYYPQLLK